MKEIKKCIICGKEFTSTCKNAMMCSAECKKLGKKKQKNYGIKRDIKKLNAVNSQKEYLQIVKLSKKKLKKLMSQEYHMANTQLR